MGKEEEKKNLIFFFFTQNIHRKLKSKQKSNPDPIIIFIVKIFVCCMGSTD